MAVAIFEDNKLIDKSECTNRYLIAQADIILDKLKQDAIINIEDCLYTSASASKDRDYLLKIIGSIKYKTEKLLNINWVSPHHNKFVVKNMENLSKYNDSFILEFEKNINLTYQYGNGWKYNNQKISNHL